MRIDAWIASAVLGFMLVLAGCGGDDGEGGGEAEAEGELNCAPDDECCLCVGQMCGKEMAQCEAAECAGEGQTCADALACAVACAGDSACVVACQSDVCAEGSVPLGTVGMCAGSQCPCMGGMGMPPGGGPPPEDGGAPPGGE